jgi:hypothetical protein
MFRRSCLQISIAALWMAALSQGRGAQLDEYVETLASLTDCGISASGARIEYAASGRAGVVEVPYSQATHWPSPAYRSLVAAAFAVQGTCPAQGEQLRLTHCPRCEQPSTVSVERGGQGPKFDEEQRSLWVVRQFVDRKEPQDQHAALFMILRVLARYNRADGGSRSVWIRDRLERSLFAYASAEKAAMAIERFGRPSLRPGVEPLVRIFAARSKDIGLVKALPYMPADPRSPALVGAWGQFPLSVFVETDDGRLLKLYEQR